ncbi:hypothetical protein [Herbidospora cretacea]|uniref:hypothetical protein n=1 Tax=Herbidospora cretacea TaxID=28444 RepID=UPI0012F81375|nr:hypothetical protein [Herbidospora cretacea]
MPRTSSLLVAALAVSACIANTSPVSAASSSSAHASMSATAALSQGSQTTVTPKQTAIDKTKALLTTFFTDQQLSKILDRLAADIYANKSLKDSSATLITSAGLTAAQTLVLVKLASGSTGAPLTKVNAVLLRRFEPYYKNISQKILAMKKSGKTQSECAKQVHVMVAGYLTKANVTPILTDIKAGLTSTEWQFVKLHGASLFLWSKHGL